MARTIVDDLTVQFQRLVIDAGSESFALEFHERLTVIANIGDLEREGLVNELVGALGTGRTGVHLEMMSDAGNRFAIFRPAGARHCVVDIQTAEDVSSTFRNPDGSIDILARAGLTQHEARRTMCVTPESIQTTSEADRYVEALGRIDQGRLWELAAKVQLRESELAEEAAAVGSAPADVELAAAIDARHHELEEVQEAHESLRSTTLWLALGLAVCAIPIGMVAGAIGAFPLLAGAAGAGLVSMRYFRDLQDAEAAESAALAQAGAGNYLSYQLERVNGLLASDGGRKQLMSAAEALRATQMEWRLIAGDVSVDWAMEHRAAIRASAARSGGQRLGRSAESTTEVLSQVISDISDSVRLHLDKVAKMGPGGESFPIIFDEPFRGLNDAARPALLELLANTSANQQIILLTDDPAIASWARVESLTGQVAVIEPARSGSEDGAENPTERRRHVAA